MLEYTQDEWWEILILRNKEIEDLLVSLPECNQQKAWERHELYNNQVAEITKVALRNMRKQELTVK